MQNENSIKDKLRRETTRRDHDYEILFNNRGNDGISVE